MFSSLQAGDIFVDTNTSVSLVDVDKKTDDFLCVLADDKVSHVSIYSNGRIHHATSSRNISGVKSTDLMNELAKREELEFFDRLGFRTVFRCTNKAIAESAAKVAERWDPTPEEMQKAKKRDDGALQMPTAFSLYTLRAPDDAKLEANSKLNSAASA